MASASQDEIRKAPRDAIETDLRFAGFVAFRCLMRKDSKEVIKLLLKSGHRVSMITGDNVLTALHVASEVGLTKRDREKVVMLETMDGAPHLQWVSAANHATVAPFALEAVEKFAEKYDLCVSGKVLQRAFGVHGDALGAMLHLIKVFARMAPDGKERVLSLLNGRNMTTLMCGDGANDVGALRQAHVGVALLSGFGSLNADKAKDAKGGKDGKSGEDPDSGEDSDDDGEEGKGKGEGEGGKSVGFFEGLKLQMAEADKKAKQAKEERKKKMDEMKAKREKYQKDMQEKRMKMMREVEEETARLTAAGESFAQFKAMKSVMAKQQAENKKKISDAGGTFAFSAAALAAKEAGENLDDGELPVLKLGDASIAAPFTSKFPSIRSVYDIIRQGRCTLVTSIQNNQIMCLNSLISSYSLSVLYLDGIKFSDYQMTATGMLLTAAHLAVSHVAPLKQVSAVRPITSLFNPALFFSLFGQFAIHLSCMIIAVGAAKVYMDPDFKQDMEGKFTPNLINTVVFYVESVQQVSVLMVNYRGRPFQPGLDENKALLHSLGISCIGLYICAFEVIPPLNQLLEVVSLPSDGLKWTIISILTFDVVGALLWDRFMHFVFARKLFIASQSKVDLPTLAKGCFKVAVSALCVYMLCNGSGIVGLGLVYFAWKNGFF